MNHGFLITAYKDTPQLYKLVQHLDSKNSYFYIHIDKKSNISDQALIQQLKIKPNVNILENAIPVNWGGFSHLKAILLLIKIALNNGEISYFHTLSGQCFPIKPINEIMNFFEKNKNLEFIDFFKMPTTKLFEGGLNRLQLFRPNDIFNEKGNFFERKTYSLIIKLQKLVHIKRSYPKNFPQLYWGSTWWSLSRDCLEYVIQYIKHNPDFIQRFKHTFCAEEMLFQTIIVNSIFKRNIINENLRYIDWTEKNGNSPSILDETDYNLILNSKKLFARKFDSQISSDLLQKIISNHQLQNTP
ncbi:beta-1,6-N-acetylglucosaminyltransferase [Ancylomarina longa]|uniref:Peptide O-xylosyltransferase n=1 Tax=Ancylomarina longa TaxID=2487017 RepID=A0A434AZL1_9BACT|nr:beta-1,6-N-acetylglucosaminyltransferase [Ancylomarina longa]RUT79887.1 hypothetical protein DLK05_00595 [Ancylomarina longa]